jgi:predicted LPLAT superfamily acyltransferase
MSKDVVIGFKSTPELDQRLRVLQERFQERIQVTDLSRSQFIRNLIERGAEVLEKELSKERL